MSSSEILLEFLGEVSPKILPEVLPDGHSYALTAVPVIIIPGFIRKNLLGA